MAKKAATTETKKAATKKAATKKTVSEETETTKEIVVKKTKKLSFEEQLALDNYENQCKASKYMHGF